MSRKNRYHSGLDISGVGKSSIKLPGGDFKSHNGLPIGDSRPQRGASAAAHRKTSRRKGDYVGSAAEARVPRKTVAIIVAVVVGALALAIAVGVLVYQQTVRNALKSDIDTNALSSVLTAPDSSDADQWAVLVKTDAASAESGRGSVSYLAAVYFDTDNKSVTFLWIPTDTRVYIDGYGYHQIKDAFDLEGETGIVSCVEKVAGIDASHYIEFNDAGLTRFEESLGSIGIDASSASRDQLTSAICKRIFGSSSEQLSEVSSSFVNCAATDVSASDLTTLFGQLQGMDTESDLYQQDAPSSSEVQDGVTYSILDTDSWNTIVKRTESGLSPVATKKELSTYRSMRNSNTVDIWNGVGVSGVANDCKTELEKLGWTVGECGNAAQFVYSETLIVYNDAGDKDLADLLVSDLGQGRAVLSGGRYSFSGSILVVIGKDYKPY